MVLRAPRKDPWSKDEDERLVMAYQKYGSRWAEISKLFDCRTDNAIKNRWYGNLRKSTRSMEKSSQSPGSDSVKKSEMSPSAGSKRHVSDSPPPSEEGRGHASKRQHLGGGAGGVRSEGFSTVAEAMVACFKVFEELHTVHLPKVMASIKYEHKEDCAISIPSELKEIKGKLEQNLYRTPHDFHRDIVNVWRRCGEEDKGNKELYTLASTLSKAFDELYFRSVYMPLNVVTSAFHHSKPAKVGSRVRIYNAQEHKWWYGILTEHHVKDATSLVTEIVPDAGEGEQPQDPLQVWTSIPSFYAEVVPEIAARKLADACTRAAATDGEVGKDRQALAVLKATLERTGLSKLFPEHKGGHSVIEALRSFVEAQAVAQGKTVGAQGVGEGSGPGSALAAAPAVVSVANTPVASSASEAK